MELGLPMHQPAVMQKFPINITASNYFLESCCTSVIHYLGSSTTVPIFLQVSPRKIKNLISGCQKNFENIFQGASLGPRSSRSCNIHMNLSCIQDKRLLDTKMSGHLLNSLLRLIVPLWFIRSLVSYVQRIYGTSTI